MHCVQCVWGAVCVIYLMPKSHALGTVIVSVSIHFYHFRANKSDNARSNVNFPELNW